MTNLLTSLLRSRDFERSSFPALTMADLVSAFSFDGIGYPLYRQTMQGPHQEDIDGSFESYVEFAYRRNGVVFACMLRRMLIFTEARFQFQQMTHGRPGELFGTTALEPLEHPEIGKTTGDLLARVIQDADLSGNFFATRRRGSRPGEPTRIKRLRPDWVTIILGSYRDPTIDGFDIDAEVIGYLYHPGGLGHTDPDILLPEEVAHFAPIPDPTASYRGMSWLTPVIREIMSDSASTNYKQKFFENGATPSMIISLDSTIKPDGFREWIKMFREKHEGSANAFKTLYLGAGAKAEVVGRDLRQLDFKNNQAAGETRIASAAGVPPILAGLSEGLAAGTYSNYAQAKRHFADGTIRPLWRNLAGSLERLVAPPTGARLWYDDRDIPFLAEDRSDSATVQNLQALSIKSLTDAGYDWDSVVKAVTSGDFSKLKHTGLYSVQLQPPGSNLTGKPNAPQEPKPKPPKSST